MPVWSLDLDFKPIGLADKPLIDGFLARDAFGVSDVHFNNLYLWRKAREISYTIIHDCLIIATKYPDQAPFYFYPIGLGDKKAVLQALIAHAPHPLELRALQSQHVAQLEAFFPNAFAITPIRDRFDYIYSVSELITLSGKKFHKKKNHLNAFLKTHPHFSFESISPHNIDPLMEVLQEWHALDDPQDVGLAQEHKGILEALQVYDQLGMQGGVIKIGDKIVAMSFGEMIQKDMALIHIEKASPHVRGAYQMINQQLLAHAFSTCAWVNREEDLGIEGLRQAKMGYHPAYLLEKHHAILKNP
ncbi:DUF2156 domain-containing protein [Helicobacter bizzozeronii]|uniref:DUF2156 domain-containing protein n=1 Tax=Helicobacter bizzozeronii TaxID=56877 RepID=UPI000CEE560C|nr:phosphatidylglycerol lysyltransferase domain-containing protein [Helicobacter bizzozeronii]